MIEDIFISCMIIQCNGVVVADVIIWNNSLFWRPSSIFAINWTVTCKRIRRHAVNCLIYSIWIRTSSFRSKRCAKHSRSCRFNWRRPSWMNSIRSSIRMEMSVFRFRSSFRWWKQSWIDSRKRVSSDCLLESGQLRRRNSHTSRYLANLRWTRANNWINSGEARWAQDSESCRSTKAWMRVAMTSRCCGRSVRMCARIKSSTPRSLSARRREVATWVMTTSIWFFRRSRMRLPKKKSKWFARISAAAAHKAYCSHRSCSWRTMLAVEAAMNSAGIHLSICPRPAKSDRRKKSRSKSSRESQESLKARKSTTNTRSNDSIRMAIARFLWRNSNRASCSSISIWNRKKSKTCITLSIGIKMESLKWMSSLLSWSGHSRTDSVSSQTIYSILWMCTKSTHAYELIN